MRTLKLEWLISQANEMGVRTDEILLKAGLPASTSLAADVGPDECVAILGALFRLLPEDFALGCGLKWHCATHGLVGYALLNHGLIGDYVDRWLHYSNFIGRLLHLQSVVDAEGWHLDLRPNECMPVDVLECCVEESFASMFPAWRRLTGRPFAPTHFEVTTTNANRIALIERTLRVTVRGGARQNRAFIPVADRRLPLAVSSQDIMQWYQRHCAHILPDLIDAPWPFAEIRHQLLTSYGNPPSVTEASAALRMSKRSFNRVLAKGGQNYQDLVGRYRREYALELLRAGELTIKDVAYAVGFTDPRCLRRSFHQWTGLTIGGWARDQRQKPPPRQWQMLSASAAMTGLPRH